MTTGSIAFIGAGNMATALIQGLISNGTNPQTLWASDLDERKLTALRDRCGIRTETDNAALVRQADVVVLAVKPQGLREVARSIAPALREHPCLLMSIAAGIPLSSLNAWTAPDQPIVRCMPNTPALVQAGATALCANAAVSAGQKQAAQDILSAVGTAVWLQAESEMDAVTALSGSGPAYFFLLMEAMQAAGTRLGLDPETARALCVQTGYGAARLALESEVTVDELRRRVTSPGGTTEAALQQFEADGLRDVVGRALSRAAERSRELAQQSGDEK